MVRVSLRVFLASLPILSLHLWADTIIVGLVGLPPFPYGGGNCIPFGCPNGFGQISTYQQIYTSDDFLAPVTITAIDFYHTYGVPFSVPASGSYDLSLSYSAKPVDGLDTTDPLNNIGSGSELFFGGSLPAIDAGVLRIPGIPFLYDPALGNLLLTVEISSAVDGYLYPDASTNQNLETRRAVFTTAGNFANDAGLITGFEVVPEPESVFLLCTGLGILLAAERRRHPIS